jgi:hypothetical protein
MVCSRELARTSSRARESASIAAVVSDTCLLTGADAELWEPSHSSERDSAYDGSRV